jgi:hypothetical protein
MLTPSARAERTDNFPSAEEQRQILQFLAPAIEAVGGLRHARLTIELSRVRRRISRLIRVERSLEPAALFFFIASLARTTPNDGVLRPGEEVTRRPTGSWGGAPRLAQY